MGSNFATNWGSVGFFGPVSVRPDLWDMGIGARLVEPAMERFAEWGIEHAVSSPGPQPQAHLSLPEVRFLGALFTAIMSKSVVERLMVGEDEPESSWSRFSALSEEDREDTLEACGELTGAIYDGLDVSGEIRAVASQDLGDTVLLQGIPWARC